jgi:hypothetical protein
MAGRTITFDADDLIKDLDIIRRVQMPFVASWSLNQLGPKIRKFHQTEMARSFNNPVPFTTNSPRWGANGYQPWTRSTKQNLEMGIWISEDGAKGQDPARYLFPQMQEDGRSRKQVYVTRFSKALRRRGALEGSEYALPIRASSAARLNSYGNISPGQYTQVLYAIGAMTEFTARQAGKSKRGPSKEYFAVPSRTPAGGRKSNLNPGIYRRKGDSIAMLFKTLPEAPDVSPKYDFYGLTQDLAEDYFPDLVQKKLNEVMGGR